MAVVSRPSLNHTNGPLGYCPFPSRIRFLNLTPPSVNSMLIRLEQREFIRRIPGKARAIELAINLDWIPPLDRPFRF